MSWVEVHSFYQEMSLLKITKWETAGWPESRFGHLVSVGW